jgi:hypothetical protein
LYHFSKFYLFFFVGVAKRYNKNLCGWWGGGGGVLESYKNYNNGVMSYQLTGIGRRGDVWMGAHQEHIRSKSVEWIQRGYSVYVMV